MDKNKLEQKAQELIDRANRIREIANIYERIVNEMNWYAKEVHDPDDEHEERWFSDPEEGSYKYDTFLAYNEVLEAVEKLVK